MSDRADERPVRDPQPGEDMAPTSVNIAEYERLANERDKPESKKTANKSTKN